MATGGAGPLRYTQCVCPSDYKYTTSNVGEGFAVKGETCKDSEGEKYWNYQCASNYVEKGKCPDGQKEFNEKPKGNLRCVQCTNKTCSDYTANDKAMLSSKPTCGSDEVSDEEIKKLGTADVACYSVCRAKRCSEYGDGDYRADGSRAVSLLSCTDLGDGYKKQIDTFQNGALECGKCVAKTCADYGYASSGSGITGYKMVAVSVQLGSSTRTCYNPVPKTCEDYIENGVRLQSTTCSSGYIQTSYTKALGSNSNGTCYRCVRRTSSDFTLTITSCHKSCSNGRELTLTPTVSINGSNVSAGQHSGGNYDMSIPYSGNAKDQFRLVMKETTARTTSTRTQRDAVNGRVDAVSYNFKAGSYYTVTCEIGSCGSSS